jgi:hypothetical protein
MIYFLIIKVLKQKTQTKKYYFQDEKYKEKIN